MITTKRPVFIHGDIRDRNSIENALEGVDTVIHFAGLKSVGESVSKPTEYYDNNVNGTLVLLSSMCKKGVKRIIFSSSSTVYGTPQSLPLTEKSPTGEPTNPYGRSKLHIEQILKRIRNLALFVSDILILLVLILPVFLERIPMVFLIT